MAGRRKIYVVIVTLMPLALGAFGFFRVDQYIEIVALNVKLAALKQLGKLQEKLPYAIRYRELSERKLGQGHFMTRVAYSMVATSYEDRSQYRPSLSERQKLLAIERRVLGPASERVANTLTRIAGLHAQLEEDDAFVATSIEALGIYDAMSHPDPDNVRLNLLRLSWFYALRGRDEEAAKLLGRAKAIAPDAAVTQVDRAFQTLDEAFRLVEQGRGVDALAMRERALGQFVRARGEGHPDSEAFRAVLANSYMTLGRFAEAEAQLRRMIEITETVYGHDNLKIAGALDSLASSASRQGQPARTVAFSQRILDISSAALPSNHPQLAADHLRMSFALVEAQQWTKALEHARQAGRVAAARTALGVQSRRNLAGNTQIFTRSFKQHLSLAAQVAGTDPGARAALAEETFVVAQRLARTAAAAALSQMSARFAANNTALAPVIREQQELQAQLQRTDQALVTALSQQPARRDKAHEQRLRREVGETEARLDLLATRITGEFKGFAELTSASPLTLADVQGLLEPDEALVVFEFTESGHAWVMTKGAALWYAVPDEATVRQHVEALRCGLDASNWADTIFWPTGSDVENTRARDQKRRRDKCVELTGLQRTGNDPPPFDVRRAHALYAALLGPAAEIVRGQKNLIVVPSGPLSMLPFQTLVSALPETAAGAADSQQPGFQNVTWVGLEHPLSVLPSVANLRALRNLPSGLRAKRPYIGFGNPLLDGASDNAESAKLAAQASAISDCIPAKPELATRPGTVQVAMVSRALPQSGIFTRSGHADTALLLQMEPLPETADELCAVAALFPAPNGDAAASKTVWLGHDATEHNLKAISRTGELETYAVVHFATHGLLAAESELFTRDASTSKGKSEPSLVLTPPKNTGDASARDDDDGLLTASEIAALRLNADWVILSACNTAAGETESGEALSGLARAFFFAGAKAVLVSHWPVYTSAAQTLIKSAFGAMALTPSMSRAEAMRVAMQQLHQAAAHQAQWQGHPALWAPFTIVGEGRSLK